MASQVHEPFRGSGTLHDLRVAKPPRQVSAPPTQPSPPAGRNLLAATAISGTAPAFLHSKAPARTRSEPTAPTSLDKTLRPSGEPAPRFGSTLPAAQAKTSEQSGGKLPDGEAELSEAVRLFDTSASVDDDELPVPSSRFGWDTLEELGDLNQAVSSVHRPGPEPAPADPGSPQVGEYEVLARLKKGGMSTVYLCRRRSMTGFERLFAMKVLHTDWAEDLDQAVRSFFREAQLLANCHDPHVIGVVDVGTMEEPYLVLDYVEGGSLHELCEANPTNRTPELVIRILLDALAGLSALHRTEDAAGRVCGIVHCDLTPHNLLVGVDGRCRVSDLGIALARHEISAAERPLVGKPSYLAPERIRGEEFDERADVFSVGVVLYQALTGRDPFLARTAEETLRNVLELDPTPPSQVGLCPHPAFDWLCMRALSKDPSARFASADEMRSQLERIATRQGWIVGPTQVASWVKDSLRMSLEARRRAARGKQESTSAGQFENSPPAVHGTPPTEQEPPVVVAPELSSAEDDRPPPTARNEPVASSVPTMSALHRFQLLPASTQVLWVVAATLGVIILFMLGLLLKGQ